jgi:outer membrane protein assembly factor BamB
MRAGPKCLAGADPAAFPSRILSLSALSRGWSGQIRRPCPAADPGHSARTAYTRARYWFGCARRLGRRALCVIALAALGASSIHAQSAPMNWSQFRGPNGSGVATRCQPPVKIVADQAAWNTPVPPGNSSPILRANRIFLTGVRNDRLMTLALDASSGEVLWKRLAPEVSLERVHNANSVASSTPCADDDAVYVSVSMQGGRGDVTLDPEPFWAAMLQFDRDGDGRIGRDEITEHFTLPFRPELPLEHPGFGLPLPQDPAARRERQLAIFAWRDQNRDGYWTRDEFVADMSVGHGRPNLMAIGPGGTGDVTDSHVRWNLTRGIPEIPSPIFDDGRLYLVRDGGILSCVRTDTGEVVYRERLGAAGQYSASPVIANGHLYLVSGAGVITVVQTGDAFALAHQADFKAAVVATPAIDAHSLYVRTDTALLAFR